MYTHFMSVNATCIHCSSYNAVYFLHGEDHTIRQFLYALGTLDVIHDASSYLRRVTVECC